MSTVNTGWLKDNNGEKFAPKTTSTQVVMSDGSNLDGKIQNIKTKAAYINAGNNEDVDFDPNGGGVQIIDKTYEEYQALSEAEKMRDDVIYNITDREAGVVFGNDDISGIGDGTVTGAIVELDSNFNNNTLITPSVNSRFTFVSGGYVNMGKFVFVQVVVKANATASNSPSTLTIGEIKHDSALSCIDITNQISNSITASVPCGASSGGTVYIKEVTENHIYAITGMLLR